MNSKFLFFSFLFLLVGCGVKRPPRPKTFEKESFIDSFKFRKEVKKESKKEKKNE